MILRRVLTVWLILMSAEFIHGVLRTVLLVPYVGDLRARQIGVFIGSLLILIIASLFIRWTGAATVQSLILTGFVWLFLTLLFELGFGHFVLNLSWQRLVADYDITHGGLLGFGMILLTLSPLIAARLRGVKLKGDNKTHVPPEYTGN